MLDIEAKTVLHPIVAQMNPSPEQMPAIQTRGCDIAVTAGAGTGKTRTLVARFLALLADGTPIRSIVAITFTVKAAREMRNRVRDQVRGYLERTDLMTDERTRWQEIYAQLDAARISTIHSLCADILRAHPAEAGLDPRFEMLDEGQVNILRERAVEDALAWAAVSEGCLPLFSVLGVRGLRATVAAMLRNRLDAEEALGQLPPDLLIPWRQALADWRESTLSNLTADPAWTKAVSALQENIAENPDDAMERQRRAALDSAECSADLISERVQSLARLDGIRLSGGSKRNWPSGQTQLTEIKSALRTLRTLWRYSKDDLELTLTSLDEALASLMPALSKVFAVVCSRYDVQKRERFSLDFDDLEHIALALVRRDGTVRARWQKEVAAILVDEFQDTNGRQRDLVELLNGNGNKCFIVGDAKQSIYRFRGADVTVFRQEHRRIDLQGASFSLETSYRAHKDLVIGLNELLRPILGTVDDPTRPWIAPFSPLGHHREDPGFGFSPPHIELHLAVGTKTGGALARAADAAVERILDLIADEACVVENGRSRKMVFGDVVVLCRASAAFRFYEDALERAGVPYLTVAGRGFYARPEVRDLLNALQALSDPADGLALAGLLRSPALALSDAALYCLCQCSVTAAQEPAIGKRRAGTLWQALQERTDELSASDCHRAHRAIRIISDLHAQAGRLTVAELLKAFLDRTDYRAALVGSGSARGARNVAKLLADAHASGIVSVGDFLEYVSALRDTGVREGEARATAEGAVQIMTVHAAKGLEFPLVIIGDASRTGHRVSGTLIDADLGILPHIVDEENDMPAVYRMVRAGRTAQDDAESDRLLYVAATRAREKLVVSGCITLSKDGAVRDAQGWLGKMLGADGVGLVGQTLVFDEGGTGVETVPLKIGTTPVMCKVYGSTSQFKGYDDIRIVNKAASQTFSQPLLLDPVHSGIEVVDRRTVAYDAIPRQRVWRVVPEAVRPRAPAWVIGSLVHEALACWRFPDDTTSRFGRWVESRARGYGITDDAQTLHAVRQTRLLLERFLAHPLHEEMDVAERRLHEVPYSVMIEKNGSPTGITDTGIIDALYLSSGAWTIVEFKTDFVRDETHFSRILKREGYVSQAGRYVESCHRLLDQRPAFVICLLNFAGAAVVRPL